MAQVTVKYNPYRLATEIIINGRKIETDSDLYRVTKGKRLQEWCSEFPRMLTDEINSCDIDIEFVGTELDWDDFEDAFNIAVDKKIVNIHNMKYIAARSDDDVHEKIVNIFTDLQDEAAPIDAFRDASITKAFANINNSVFPINVIATMSSGKSTLINSMLRRKLMPSKNEACTAIITEILDCDRSVFNARVYSEDGSLLYTHPELTYELMNELNEDENVFRIISEGDIPFIDASETALKLIDTPGPNNSQNQSHKDTTFKSINNDSNNLILYVLNGTQLSTNDDANLLNYVSSQIKKGGKQARDRFLFVINKMDAFNPEEENIQNVINAVKKYLASYGIDDPQIFPVSAYTALNIRTYLADVDIDNLSRAEEKKLPSAARETITAIDKFNDFEQMHLEKYSTLSPSAQRELNYKLNKAIESGDTKEQALIHCGIYSIEAAITAYVKKYAKTKKIKDLVETFEEVLLSHKVLANAKEQVATDAEAAKECSARAAAIRAKIDDGSEAIEFKAKIEQLDPMPSINAKVDALEDEALATVMKVFRPLKEILTSKEEARRVIESFSAESVDAFAKLSADIESIINTEIIEAGTDLLKEYQFKLEKIDDTTENKTLDFKTADLIKGALVNMRESIDKAYSGTFVSDTVENVGETTHETETYAVKTGTEELQVKVGSHTEVVGTKRVKVGEHEEFAGTKKVKNHKRDGFWGFFKFWEPWEIEKNVYKTVEDFEDREITKEIDDYETIVRDIYEERTRQIEKYSIQTSKLQSALAHTFQLNLDKGIEESLDYAETEIGNMKSQFKVMFEELDAIIKAKYDELEQCAADETANKEKYENNKRILEWLEANIKEIDETLNIF